MKFRAKKWIALLLALVMLMSFSVPTVWADDIDDVNGAKTAIEGAVYTNLPVNDLGDQGMKTAAVQGVVDGIMAGHAGVAGVLSGADTSYSVALTKNAETGTAVITASFVLSDTAAVAAAKTAVAAMAVTNLVVADPADQGQKTAMIQTLADAAVLAQGVTAVVAWNDPNYDVTLTKNAASDTASITTATFTDADGKAVLDAKAAVGAAAYANLSVDDLSNQGQKTAAVQTVVDAAVLPHGVTAVVTWADPAYSVALTKNLQSDSASVAGATFKLSDTAAVAAAKTAVESAVYTNLVVSDLNNGSQKTTAVQAVVNNAILGSGVSAATVFNTPNYDVTLTKGAASVNTSIATATFKTPDVGGGGGAVVATAQVSMAVVDNEGKLLFGPSDFTVSDSGTFKLTVLGALDASGASYKTGYWEKWGYYVDAVCGVAGSGGAGWMYAKNGVPGAVMAGSCNIVSGDKIVWYYVSSMDAVPPQWSDLEKLKNAGTTGGGSSTVVGTPLKADALKDALKNAAASGVVDLKAGEKETVLALSGQQLKEILGAGKPLAMTVQGIQFTFDLAAMDLKDALGNGDSKVALKVEKLSDWELQNKVEPFSGRLKLAGDIYEFKFEQVIGGKTQTIEKIPGCTVVLPVPEGLKQNAEAGVIMAYWFNEETKEWELMGGVYDKVTGALKFNTGHFSKYALLEATGSFDDVDGKSRAKEITILAANGYVKGVEEGTFCPEGIMTRAQFVTLATRLAGFKSEETSHLKFKDVASDAWYAEALNMAAAHGLIANTDSEFAPDRAITWEELSAICCNLLKTNAPEAKADPALLLKDLADCRDNKDALAAVSRAEAAAAAYKMLMKMMK